jgi:hypothetical protein
MATIFRKTSKGQTEIETRALKLAPRFRSLLILVDGRRSDEELLRLMPQAGADALAALAEGGFIEAIGVTAAPAPRSSSPPAAPAAPPPEPAAPGFEQRRRESVRTLIDLVGPMAEALAVKMEGARNATELKPLIETAAQIVANTRGRATATTYLQRFGGD